MKLVYDQPGTELSGSAAPALDGDGDPSERSGGFLEDPDVRLMLRACSGDRGAFEDLFRKHGGPLLNLAYRYVGNRARAEEIVQDAFLRVYRRRNRYRPTARFSTFIYRVVVNLCLNEIGRAEHRTGRQSLDEKRPDEVPPADRLSTDSECPTEDDFLGREFAERIRNELGRLPENQRIALLLSRVDGFTYMEVAEILNTSVSAVKSLVFRATRTLKESLHDDIEAASARSM